MIEDATTGISCMHVNGMVLDRVTVNGPGSVAMNIHGVTDLEIKSFRTETQSQTEPAIRLSRVQDAVIAWSKATAARKVFLELNGADCKDISMGFNRVGAGVKEVDFTDGAQVESIRRL